MQKELIEISEEDKRFMQMAIQLSVETLMKVEALLAP